MTFLIVEDDPFKHGEILGLLQAIRSDIQVKSVNSVRGAIVALEETSYECIFLDIALPSHDLRRGEGAPTSMPSGGLEILLELSYLDRSDPIVVITQYPEVEIEGKLISLAKVPKTLKGIIEVNLLGVVQFDKYTVKWKDEIRKIMGENFA